MWNGHMAGDWGWWVWFGWLWMFAFWGLLVGGVLALFRRGGNLSGGSRDEAVEILRRRFAAGEIDTDEFRRRHDELTRG